MKEITKNQCKEINGGSEFFNDVAKAVGKGWGKHADCVEKNHDPRYGTAAHCVASMY